MTIANNDHRPASDDEWDRFVQKAYYLIEHNYVNGDIFDIASRLYKREKRIENQKREECR